MRRTILLALCFALVPFAVFAAEAVIDATPIFDTAANALEILLTGVASVVVGWVGWAANRWFGADTAAKARVAVESALQNGVNVIMREVRTKGRPLAEITVDSPVVAMGVSYVLTAVPTLLAQLKIGKGELAAKLVARLPVPPTT